MRFARIPAVLLAATHLLLLASPAASQVRSRGGYAAAKSAAAFSHSFRESSATVIQRDPVVSHILSLGARGTAVAQAREHVISILTTENSCSAWFRQADPDPAAVFESLDFMLYDGPKFVAASRSPRGEMLFMHPYSAAVEENAGNNATIQLNANGPFFARAADILERDLPGSFAHFAGRMPLHVGPYDGDTLLAQITILLHELGHVIGRIPDDSSQLSGLSGQNTQRVLQACHAEIKASTHPHRVKAN
jgi:hypothetical protein